MSQIRISRENFFHNISQIADKTQSVEKIALVLKDNAYGHGLKIMANLAAEAGVRHAVVRSLAEANIVGELFETILILSDTPSKPVSQRFRFVINDIDDIKKMPPDLSIELKVDTGMHRNGIEPDRFKEAVGKIFQRGLHLKGVMTHYRSADELGSDFFWQKKRFEEIKDEAKELGLTDIRWHSCNSAALFRLNSFDEDIARVGIAAYGCLSMPSSFDTPELKPVMSLWAKRVSSRRAAPASRIGYGGEGRVEKDCIVSSYDIGYGDGWQRAAYTLPDGRPIIGRVSMDMISVEGKDENICIFSDAAEAARQLGTISYVVMTQLSPSIERVVV
ncbi:MAG: alanine racemase [Hydrogenimonas sp.]|nr:alanine racemase [Hydrogenimonas sp.]